MRLPLSSIKCLWVIKSPQLYTRCVATC